MKPIDNSFKPSYNQTHERFFPTFEYEDQASRYGRLFILHGNLTLECDPSFDYSELEREAGGYWEEGGLRYIV